MTVLQRHENAPTWYLRCDRCQQPTWHEDAAQEPEAPHICPDCQSPLDARSAHAGPGPDLENDTWQTKAHMDDLFGPGREP